MSGKDKRGTYLRCSQMLETGLCDNRRTMSLQFIEDKVMQGIEEHLASRDLLAEYVREYHRAYTELRDRQARRRADLIKRLAKLKTDIKRAVPAVMEDPEARLFKLSSASWRINGTKLKPRSATSNRPPLSNCTPMWMTFTAGKFAT